MYRHWWWRWHHLWGWVTVWRSKYVKLLNLISHFRQPWSVVQIFALPLRSFQPFPLSLLNTLDLLKSFEYRVVGPWSLLDTCMRRHPIQTTPSIGMVKASMASTTSQSARMRFWSSPSTTTVSFCWPTRYIPSEGCVQRDKQDSDNSDIYQHLYLASCRRQRAVVNSFLWGETLVNSTVTDCVFSQI